MKHDMLYVCLAGTSKHEYVMCYAIQGLKPYAGYIYRCSYDHVSYIGCSTDIEKEQHKEHTTNKFGRALEQYGYDSFECECLETVHFSERQSLLDIEYMYIMYFDSINNGYNALRNYIPEL